VQFWVAIPDLHHRRAPLPAPIRRVLTPQLVAHT
jgi:hypothetical protein